MLSASLKSFAQQRYVKLMYDATAPRVLSQEYKQKNARKLNSAAAIIVNEVLKTLHNNGFLYSYLSDSSGVADTTQLFFHVGEQVRWGMLTVDDADDYLLNKTDLDASLTTKPFSYPRYSARLEKLLNYLEDNGYPFAEIKTDTVLLINDSLTAKLKLDKKKFVTIDSIYIPPDARITRRYLYNYLQINPKDPYNESLIRKIPTRIKELQFIELTKPPTITFFADKAVLNLLIKNKNQNRFDFILGVLPTPASVTGKRLLVTGDGKLNLLNALGKGEKINLRFEKLQARTTRLRADAAYPFIFNLPFGINGDFNLYFNDTLYRDLEYNVGFSYLFSGTQSIKVYYGMFQSRLVTIDTNVVKFSHKLPNVLDVNANRYGIAYQIDKTNFRLNPSSGFTFDIDVAASLRQVKRNARITGLTDPLQPEFNYNSLYDSLKVQKSHLIIRGGISYYLPLFASGLVLALRERSGYLSGQQLLNNELYRLGGFRNLRGFDEESIPARWYHTGTIELRYLLGTFSYAALFADGGYVNRKTTDGYVTDVPVGIGAGLNFQTRAGIFSINYAVGRNSSTTFDFRAAKIHFGYLTVF